MDVELKPLLSEAFFRAQVAQVPEALDQARLTYVREHEREGTSYEVAVPAQPDEAWLADTLSRLVYYCESTGRDVPECRGMFVALFAADGLYCVEAEKLIRFAEATFHMETEELRARYGTHELHTGVQR